MSCLFKPNQKLVMIGDSITDCGRRNEPHAPYGAGYAAMVRNFLIARYPGYNLDIVNRGISGDTIRDLDARWQADVIQEKPDVLSIKIGINDVWRTVNNKPDQAVPLDEYEATYRRLLQTTHDQLGCQFILMDPYVLETDHSDLFRSLIDQYIDCVHRIAADFKAISVHTQEVFDEAMAQQPSSFWAGDRVHPQSYGHALITLAFLRAVGFEF